MAIIQNNNAINQAQNFLTTAQGPKPTGADKMADLLQGTNETASITDGTIRGADNDHFTLNNGKRGQSYNLFSNRDFSLTGMIDPQGGVLGSVNEAVNGSSSMDLSNTGFSVWNPNNAFDSNLIEFDKNGQAFMDGQSMQEGEIYMLKDGGAAILQGSTLTIKTAGGDRITQEADAANDCVNVSVDPGLDGTMLKDLGDLLEPNQSTGVLGQTFDLDKQVYTDAGVDLRDHEIDGLFGGRNIEKALGDMVEGVGKIF